MEVFVLMRLLPYDRTFLKPIIAAVVSFLGAQLLSLWFPADNIWYLIPHVILVWGVYGGLLWLMGLAPEDQTVILRLVSRIKTMVISSWNTLTRKSPAKSSS